MYTITGYTMEQINCDDNGANEYPTSVKKDYLVEIKRNMFKSSVAHKETSTFMKWPVIWQLYDTVVYPNEVYMIETLS